MGHFGPTNRAPLPRLLRVVVALCVIVCPGSAYPYPADEVVNDVYGSIHIWTHFAILVLETELRRNEGYLGTSQWLHGFAPSPVITSQRVPKSSGSK